MEHPNPERFAKRLSRAASQRGQRCPSLDLYLSRM